MNVSVPVKVEDEEAAEDATEPYKVEMERPPPPFLPFDLAPLIFHA